MTDARGQQVISVIRGTNKARWDRVLLKLSGEAFAGQSSYGIDGPVVEAIAAEIAAAYAEFDVDIGVVVGGGNIWRGMTGASTGMDRAQADYMGMLATVINALALQDALERLGVPRGCRRRCIWRRSPSPTSGAGRSGTWRRAGW